MNPKRLLLITSTLLITLSSCNPVPETSELSTPSTNSSDSVSIENSTSTNDVSENTSIEVSAPEISVAPPTSPSPSAYPSVSDEDKIPGLYPVVSNDKKTVKYGFYPQSYVSDTSLISTLNTLEFDSTSRVFYKGNYFIKETAKLYNNEDYTFNDGVQIINGQEYWFKLEPIEWTIINYESGRCISTYLLDASPYFYSNNSLDVLSNKYQESYVYSFLQEEFFNRAFQNNYTYLLHQHDGYVTLPYKDDLTFESYGFTNNASRISKTTDFARARGAWYNEDTQYKYNGVYWTKSPSEKYDYCVNVVNSAGVISEYPVDTNSNCIRPLCEIYYF